MTITKMNQNIVSQFLPAAGGSGIIDPVIAQFPTTPPGYVQTGTISAVCQQAITAGSMSNTPAGTFDSGNDILSEMVWTLYRNGQAEQTWQGAAMMCNVQSFGDSNDYLTVVGNFFPGAAGPNGPVNFLLDYPINVSVNYIGYVGQSTEIPLVVPFVSMSAQSSFEPALPTLDFQLLEMSSATAILPTSGDQTLIASAPPGGNTGNVMLFSAYISLSVGGTSSATALTASIQDANGVVYCAASIVDGASGNSANTTVDDLHGIATDAYPIKLHFQSTGATPNAVCSAGLLWQPEPQNAALVQSS